MLSGVPGACDSWYAEMAEWVPAISISRLLHARGKDVSREEIKVSIETLCAAKAALHLNGTVLALAAVNKIQDRHAQC